MSDEDSSKDNSKDADACQDKIGDGQKKKKEKVAKETKSKKEKVDLNGKDDKKAAKKRLSKKVVSISCIVYLVNSCLIGSTWNFINLKYYLLFF